MGSIASSQPCPPTDVSPAPPGRSLSQPIAPTSTARSGVCAHPLANTAELGMDGRDDSDDIIEKILSNCRNRAQRQDLADQSQTGQSQTRGRSSVQVAAESQDTSGDRTQHRDQTYDQTQTLLESQTLEGDTDAELLASLADSQAMAHSVVGGQDEGIPLRDAELLASLAESQPTEHPVVGDQEENITPLAAPAHAPVNSTAMPDHDVITPEDDTHTSKAIFDETVHWRKRFIKLPTGTAGKEFVSLVTTQIRRFLQSDGTSSEAMYNLSLLPVLLLQLPSSDSTPQANASHLLRRIALWNSGAMESLLTEGQCLQEVLFRTTQDEVRRRASQTRLGSLVTVSDRERSMMPYGY